MVGGKGTEEQMLQISRRLAHLRAEGRNLGWLGEFILPDSIQTFIEHLLCAIPTGGTSVAQGHGRGLKNEEDHDLALKEFIMV